MNNIHDEKIKEKKLVNEPSLNKNVKNISKKRRNQNISNKSRIKSRER